jgi:hypothetical protein
MAVLCLASTFAIAQGQPQTMPCLQDNGKGLCTAATTAEGTEVLVVGPDLERGDTMRCVDRGNVVDCRPALREARPLDSGC